MYLPRHFHEERIEVLRELVQTHPLATLVTLGPGGLIASHVPLIYDAQPAPWGTLRGHLSRANPQWESFQPEVEALAIFQGPQTYVSPSWYATKRETGRVVPTWNYAVVHAYGSLETYTEPQWLRAHLRLLTASQEAKRSSPWALEDAPAEYIDGQVKGIVGIEIRVTRFEGKWKVSQNRTLEDRREVIKALEADGSAESMKMAELVRDRSKE